MNHIEELSSYKAVPGFHGGTVGQTAVTKMEKVRHEFRHCSSYTFYPMCGPHMGQRPRVAPTFLGVIQQQFTILNFLMGIKISQYYRAILWKMPHKALCAGRDTWLSSNWFFSLARESKWGGWQGGG